MSDDAETRAHELFDAVCARPVSELLDADRALAALDAGLAPDRVRHWATTLWIPMRERVIARMAGSEAKLGAWLPEGRRKELLERAGRPAPLPKPMVDELVGSEKMREAVRGMINDTLTTFIQKSSGALADVGKGSSGGGALRGAFGLGARMAGSVIGNVGELVQPILMNAVKDQLDGAVSNVQTRIGERLRSDETAKALGKRRGKAVERLLETTEARAVRDASKVPWAEVDAGAPAFFAHNLARPELRAALREDVAWVAETLKGETVGSLLDAMGLRDHARDLFVRAVAPGLRAAEAPASIPSPDDAATQGI